MTVPGQREFAFVFILAALMLASHLALRQVFPNWAGWSPPAPGPETGPRKRRLLLLLAGAVVTFAAAAAFSRQIWTLIAAHAAAALRQVGANRTLVAVTPAEVFETLYVRLPLLVTLFLAALWIPYLVWRWTSSASDARRRRWAVRSACATAFAFLLGGALGYAVGLPRLLALAAESRQVGNTLSLFSMEEYVSLLAASMLGAGFLLALPVLMASLALSRFLAPPRLVAARVWVVPALAVATAVLTPTRDELSLLFVLVALCLLFYVGLLAGWLVWAAGGARLRKIALVLAFLVLDRLLIGAAALIVVYAPILWRLPRA